MEDSSNLLIGEYQKELIKANNRIMYLEEEIKILKTENDLLKAITPIMTLEDFWRIQ
jgi:hypothetical protein